MVSLKQQMRQMFDERNRLYFSEKNARLEEGILEKIVNITFFNLYSYSPHPWKIIAVRSPLQLQKLYRVTGDERIPDCGAVLIIIDDMPAAPENQYVWQHDLDMLSLSLMLTAKFNYLETFIVKEFSHEAVIRELPLKSGLQIATMICLRCFHAGIIMDSAHTVPLYSEIVREI